MIHEETDNVDKTYYDNGYEDAIQGFKELYLDFSTTFKIRLKHILKVIYNMAAVEPLSGHQLVMDRLLDRLTWII